MNQHSQTSEKRRVADLLVLLVLAGMAGLYCYDAVSASTHIYNLIMVVPLTLAIFALCAVQFFLTVRAKEIREAPAEEAAHVLPVMLLFSGYVLSLNWLGFDIGTLLFVAGFLWMQGERRWPWLIGYSVAFAFVLTFFFSRMLPYPMPVLLPVLGN